MKHANIESKHTSIMHNAPNDKFSPAVNLLFTDYGVIIREYGMKSSQHNFWQMEVVIKGNILATIEDRTMLLSAGQMIIIPPGVKHNFAYKVPRKTWSFKFDVFTKTQEGILTTVLPDDNPATKKFCDVFTQLLSGYEQIPTSLYATLEYLIGGLVVMEYSNLHEEATTPKWVIAAKEFIAVNIDKNINLEDMARHLNYTRIHLSRLCRKDLNMKLKDFFDREKMETARKKLVYSSKSVTEIAQETGFDSIYSFSRFYKRVSSLTPSEQRNLSEKN